MSTPITCFSGWRAEILKRVNSKLLRCTPYKFNRILSKPAVKAELSKLQKDFVFIPVDKAAQNVCMICKKYYMDIMNKEIDDSSTFNLVSDDEDKSLSDIKESNNGIISLKSRFPSLYATAKMHKNPRKFRFITSARETIFSNVSISVSKCLKLLLNTSKTSFAYRIKEVDNCVFIIDSRDNVVRFMNKSNQSKAKNKCVSTWDFSTLYTNIPHDKLKVQVGAFIRRIFNVVAKSKKAAKYICCSEKSKTAYFSKSRSKTNISFTAEELINYVRIIVDNSFILFHDKIYRQVIGIPMGTNCAPFLANIFLHTYEYDYLNELVARGDVETAKLISQTFRYQDDCIAFNDSGKFGEHFCHIYPPEMHLENTNKSKKVCNFLDLRISIFRGSFRYCSYDKRNDFNFNICNYPNLLGNIPWSGAYGVYISQLVRFCEINQNVNDFIKDVKVMTLKFLNQGFLKDMLKNVYLKYCFKYYYRWSKYGEDITKYSRTLFN